MLSGFSTRVRSETEFPRGVEVLMGFSGSALSQVSLKGEALAACRKQLSGRAVTIEDKTESLCFRPRRGKIPANRDVQLLVLRKSVLRRIIPGGRSEPWWTWSFGRLYVDWGPPSITSEVLKQRGRDVDRGFGRVRRVFNAKIKVPGRFRRIPAIRPSIFAAQSVTTTRMPSRSIR